MKQPSLEQYTVLLSCFLDRSIDAQEFESRFLETFKNDTTVFPPHIFEVLDALFGAVDAFCPDAELRAKNDLNEQELRAEAAVALAKLLE